MKNLQKAIKEEQLYVADRLKGIDTNFSERLALHGYKTIAEYYEDKKEFLFSEWKPEVFYIDEDFLDTQMEENIKNGITGVYIIKPKNKYYAFHGNDEIDYDECKNLGIRPIEMHYRGGTIIGSAEDLGILLVVPPEILLNARKITEEIFKIIQKNISEAVLDSNDILINGEKVMGSMWRQVGKYTIWAAQFSFGEYSEFISKVCKKEQKKKPSQFKTLKRDKLEREVLQWLCKH